MPAQVVIADSTPVLSNALPGVQPAMSLKTIPRLVQVSSVSPYVLEITAQGGTAAQAESSANAAADSYVAYIGSASPPTGPVPAQVAAAATSTTAMRRLIDILVTAGLGALAGVFAGRTRPTKASAKP
jgi:hypothetical protein